MHRIRRHLTFANVAAGTALFIALAGSGAYAAGLIGAADIRTNAIRSRHIKNGQVKPGDLAKEAAPKSAGLADDEEGDCASTPNQWASLKAQSLGPVSFQRDQLGYVHLNGVAEQCGTFTAAVFKLPAGYRPKADVERHPAIKALTDPAEVNVEGDGDVIAAMSASGDTFTLAGITFRCSPSGQNGCP